MRLLIAALMNVRVRVLSCNGVVALYPGLRIPGHTYIPGSSVRYQHRILSRKVRNGDRNASTQPQEYATGIFFG